VLITGPVEGDSYWRATPSLQALGVLDDSRPVALHETTGWGAAPGQAQGLTFENLAQQWLRRGTKVSPAALNGNVWYEPLPLDFACETEPLDALLAAALKAAGVPTHPAGHGVGARRRVVVEGRPVEIPVEASRSRLVLFERGTEKVLAATPGEPVG